MNTAKPRVAFYWCASCGGCEEAVVDVHEKILLLTEALDIVFWPAVMDVKYDEVEAFDDRSITVSFVNGAIRTDEQARLARLLRRKSTFLVAFGACAHLGGVPALANLVSREEIFRASYLSSPTVTNPAGVLPSRGCLVDGFRLELPGFWEQVFPLSRIVEVDYTIPGCPPPASQVMKNIGLFLDGPLPPRGAVLAGEKALCETCPRRSSRRSDLRLSGLRRIHEVIADPSRCFLDQGIICCGPATRGGCEEACIKGNMPCSGCFGPPPGVLDQGAKLVSAIAALVCAESGEEATKIASQWVDMAGTAYRYSFPAIATPTAENKEER